LLDTAGDTALPWHWRSPGRHGGRRVCRWRHAGR
jgi:hypothetical protein